MLNSLVADLLMALLVSVVLMFITWLISLRVKNAAIVDIAWASGYTALAFLYYWAADGWLPRKLLISLMVMSWSMRLALHLLKRVVGEHPLEDARYIELRRSFGKLANIKFLAFFQLQAVTMAFLSMVFCVTEENATPRFAAVEVAGLLVFIFALVGEWLADGQLATFRSDPQNKGQVCQVGLWSVSRHPNYFFEWLVWMAFFLIACDADFGLWTICCPALMLFFLLKVSGVPLAEQQALKSKGDKYRLYQKTTSVLVPWFRKKGA